MSNCNMISVRLKRRLRCPMCRKAPRTLVEFITGSTEFVVLADGTARAADGYHEPGEYHRLDAVCGCGHRWRIKGEIQVTGLDAIVSPTGAGSAGR